MQNSDAHIKVENPVTLQYEKALFVDQLGGLWANLTGYNMMDYTVDPAVLAKDPKAGAGVTAVLVDPVLGTLEGCRITDSISAVTEVATGVD